MAQLKKLQEHPGEGVNGFNMQERIILIKDSRDTLHYLFTTLLLSSLLPLLPAPSALGSCALGTATSGCVCGRSHTVICYECRCPAVTLARQCKTRLPPEEKNKGWNLKPLTFALRLGIWQQCSTWLMSCQRVTSTLLGHLTIKSPSCSTSI